jgi:hypothetical protein
MTTLHDLTVPVFIFPSVFFQLVRFEKYVTIAKEFVLQTVQDSVVERDSVPDPYCLSKIQRI